MAIGVPIKLLMEAVGHIVSVETTTGDVYRGRLFQAEDSMNIHVKDVYATRRDGRQCKFDDIFIRGSKIRFIILPDMLKNAPMFKKNTRGKGPPRGRGHGSRIKNRIASGIGRPSYL